MCDIAAIVIHCKLAPSLHATLLRHTCHFFQAASPCPGLVAVASPQVAGLLRFQRKVHEYTYMCKESDEYTYLCIFVYIQMGMIGSRKVLDARPPETTIARTPVSSRTVFVPLVLLGHL